MGSFKREGISKPTCGAAYYTLDSFGGRGEGTYATTYACIVRFEIITNSFSAPGEVQKMP